MNVAVHHPFAQPKTPAKNFSRRFSRGVLSLLVGSSFLFANPAFAQDAATSATSDAELTLDAPVPNEVAPAPTPAPAASPSLETAAETATEAPATTPPEAVVVPAENTAVAPAPTPVPALPAAPGKAVRKKRVFTMKTARTEDFNKPVFYDSMENLLPQMDLEYDLTQDNGKSFRIGDVVINDQSFLVALMPLNRFHPRMSAVVGGQEAAKMALVLRWPQPLWREGTLEVISRTGAVLWKEKITESKKAQWSGKLSEWQAGLLAAGVKTKFADTSVFGTHYGVMSPEEKGFRPRDESFRFCLTQTRGRSRSSLCSQRYVLRRGKVASLAKVKMSVQPRVLLRGEAAPLAQTLAVPKDAPTSLYADLATGASYEFVSLPNKLNLMDISSGKTPDQLRVVGFGTRPTVPSVILNPDDYSSLTRAIGFESTIGDMRKFWEISISTEDPKIYLPGVAGGIFAQRLDVSEVPRANARPYLDARTPSGTYTDGVKLYGNRLLSTKVTSLENGVEVDDDEPTNFTWYFKATERGQLNRSYLNLEHEGQQYRAFYELYKGFPRELSLRLSGLVSPTGSSVFLGEAAYNHWFEDVFGWTNYYVARQRWGLSAKYFQSITKLKVSSSAQADLTVTNVDLKYRFSPGLWNRDESVGAMLDYQSLVFANIKAPMFGVGGFWARSMPKVFDDMFNLVSIMRYPKWVDMEFIYYPLSLEKNVTLRTNFALNFHGKVMWSKHWFGEAGFGIKRFAVVDMNLLQVAELNTFYGTAGIGLSF